MIEKLIRSITETERDHEDIRTLVDETPYIYGNFYVPRVTHILSSMVHEDYLMRWSNYLGFKRQNYKEVVQLAADKGSFTHNFIENKLKDNKDPNMDFVPENIRQEVMNAYDSFLLWWEVISKNNKVEILMQEVPLVCQWFGGTLDILVRINDKVYLLDFKTSNNVSFKYFLQLSAYKYMLEVNHGIEVDGVGVIMFSKQDANFSEYIFDFENPDDVGFINVCCSTFFALTYAYYGRLRCEHEFKEWLKYNE